MKLDAINRPISPSASTAVGTASKNKSGCAKWSGTPKKIRPQKTVASSEYAPVTEVAIVSGSSTMMKGGGEATSSSSVPCQRFHCSAPPEPKRVDDQIPIIPAPSAA